MAVITLRPSKIDDSWHAFKDGTCLFSGARKAVEIDARLACGPGDRVVRGGYIAMQHPAAPPAPPAPKAPTPKEVATAKRKTKAAEAATKRKARAAEKKAASTWPPTDAPSER